jgi:IclR family acetate operon transcriptional repressor
MPYCDTLCRNQRPVKLGAREDVSVMHERARDPLAKGLKLLRWLMLNAAETVSVREVAEQLAMPSSSVHRLMGVLAQEGVLQQRAEGGAYALSLDFFRLAHVVAGRTPLERIAVPHMRKLVEACDESAFFSLYDAGRQQMVTVAGFESSHALRYVVETQRWKHVHVGASGLAIMAFLPPEERRAIIARTGLEPVTALSITDPERLEQELARVRQRGHACTRGQRIPGAVGLAVPVFGPDAAVLGDIGLTIPEQRFDGAAEPRLAALLCACADAIMAEIGGRRPDGLALRLSA